MKRQLEGKTEPQLQKRRGKKKVEKALAVEGKAYA